MTRAAFALCAALFAAPVLAQPGQASALLRQSADLIARRQPAEALGLLERAGELGAPRGAVAVQRGIAFDLQGDTDAAQRAYRVALEANPADAAAIRHMALSLALSGNNGVALAMLGRLGAETAEARRTLALVHALGGRQSDAAEIAASSLPIGEARRMRAFYLQLPRLAAPERAYAAHFGALPGEAPAVALAAPPAASPPPVGPTLAATPRLWVQVASLADPAKLSAEWQRDRRAAGDALGERPAHVQRINGMNRLLIGPFASEAEARAAIARLKARRVSAVLIRAPADADIGPVG